MAKRGYRLNQQYERYAAKTSLVWIKASYLRRVHECGKLFPRRQDVPSEELLHGVTGVAVSHPWLAVEHPDPTGCQLAALVKKLDAKGSHVPDNVGVFVDYCCLPQHEMSCSAFHADDGRDDCGCFTAHDKQIRAWATGASGNMGISWVFRCNAVVVLPEVPDLGSAIATTLSGVTVTPRRQKYVERGWCIFEFGVASYFQGLQFDNDAATYYGKLSIDVVKTRELLEKASYSSPGDSAFVARMWTRLMAGELMHDAVLERKAADVRKLLNDRADVNVPLQGGVTPLHLAAVAGDLGITKLLVRARADITVRDEHGDTPFDDAMRWGNKEIARFLVEVSISRTIARLIVKRFVCFCGSCSPEDDEPTVPRVGPSVRR